MGVVGEGWEGEALVDAPVEDVLCLAAKLLVGQFSFVSGKGDNERYLKMWSSFGWTRLKSLRTVFLSARWPKSVSLSALSVLIEHPVQKTGI